MAINLSGYTLVGQYVLPVSTSGGSLLAQEVSAITFNWDTGTLFVVGDGGTAIVEVTTTGTLVSSMTLAAGSSPQGTEFYDTEGLTYVGSGQFVFTEERYRQVNLVTFVADTTLDRADAQTVDLGTDIGNTGLEGLTYDPLTGGFILVKELGPIGIFQTTINFGTGTASNGSSTTVNSTNLFDPALAGLLDFSDVYALSSNQGPLGVSNVGTLLIISQASGSIVEIARDGTVLSTLDLFNNPGSGLNITDLTIEGITMDSAGNIYITAENGGGVGGTSPQMWVFAPSTTANLAPTAVNLDNPVTELDETADTSLRIRVADVTLNDDGQGSNQLSLSGADAAFFEVDNTGLYLKAGTALDFAAKPSYSVTVEVNDPAVGGAVDASTVFTLAINDIGGGGATDVFVSEIAPWSSGNSPIAGDWFELTNSTAAAINITGWKFDDSSGLFSSAVSLLGVTSIGAGESVVFIEGDAAKAQTFVNAWFGGTAPAGFQIGYYAGAGIGLSTGGDAINVFDAAGNLEANVLFGASPGVSPFATFNNAAGLNAAPIGTLSVAGENGAFSFVDSLGNTEIGSPGAVGKLFVSEVAPWSSGSVVGGDWFELTNTTGMTIDLTGWRMDDNSQSFALGAALSGVTSIAPGESVIFVEGTSTTAQTFINTWFGGTAPAGFKIGTYSGSGVGLSGTTDQVNVYNADGVLKANVLFGASTTGKSFDNAAALNNATISALSSVGTNGAFIAANDPTETGSPGEIAGSGVSNLAPTALDLGNTVTAIDENTATSARIKLADVAVTDDGLGTNVLGLTGADAALFEVDATGLYLKAGVALDFETQASLNVTVTVDDADVGASPDASAAYTLTINDVAVEGPAPGRAAITEVAPWSSGNSPLGSDWFEVTNKGGAALNISGWKVDDSSNLFSSAAALNGITSIAPGESVIFIETADLAKVQAFINLWFGGTAPAGLQIGTYTGSGIGLSTSGDAVNLFDASGVRQAGVTFGASPGAAPYATFANPAGLDGVALSALSAVGVNGGITAAADAGEIASPGTTGSLFVSEVAPWSSGTALGADWFEITNDTTATIDLAGWKMDDNSNLFANAAALSGVTSLAPGESAVFVEGDAAKAAALIAAWFGVNPPAGLKVGYYAGAGIGLSGSGDAVNVYDADGALQARASFGASPVGPVLATFVNTAGSANAALTALSVAGSGGVFAALGNANNVGSPTDNLPINDAPVFTSLAAFAAAENQLVAATLTATDADLDPLSFAITGGADDARFTIDVATGVVSFASSPDFETPEDADGNNIYQIEVTVDDGRGHTSAQTLEIALSDTAETGITLVGSKTGGILPGSTGDDMISGGRGVDQIDGGDGNDSLFGGNQDDLITGGRGADMIEGGEGWDTMIGDQGDDKLYGGNGRDSLYGGEGNDELYGEDKMDMLYGGAGDDLLVGGGGRDMLTGDAGADIFQVVFSSFYVTITDLTLGEDQLMLDAATFGLAAGSLDPAILTFGKQAVGSHAQFVYHADSGRLSWDADGAGGAKAVTFALLQNHAMIDSTDILLM